MTDATDADRRFFAALLAADAGALEALLADDFVLIDVMTGSEIPKPALVAAVGARQLRFEAIDAAEPRVRRYGATAVVTGRTTMRGTFGPDAWSAKSRYTHVFVEKDGSWRMVAAQGTAIQEG